METSLRKSAVEEGNKASDQSNGDEESCEKETVFQVGAGKRAQDYGGMRADSPNNPKRLNFNKQDTSRTKIGRLSPESESRSSSSAKKEQLDQELESTKAEMDEVMEENQRLKMCLDQVLNDYRTLQTRYRDVIQKDANRTPHGHHDNRTTNEESDELISLSLGISSSDRNKDDARQTSRNENINVEEGTLKLGLDCKFDEPKKMEPHSPNASTENSLEEVTKEQAAGETWPSKTAKNARSDGGDDEISQQNPAKRARVSVRVRCDTPTMNDGCQWRKYGQKIAKGNPCPRAYYRCTVAPSCPVRKQVQRCAEDMSILITTYEGTHNHPLPVAATAMASTTSAAASMLLSGSSTSGIGLSATPTSSTSTTANLNGLNFYVSDNSRSKPFYLPNSSISSTPSFPTITLDLTTGSSSSSSSLSRLGNFLPRYSTTNLNFSNSLESNALPISWSNGVLSYGSNQFNKNQSTSNSLNFGSQSHETLYQSYLQRSVFPNPNPNPNPNPSQQSLPPDTIAAATKAITSDPSFQSALAAALTSIIGSSGAPTATTLGNYQNGGEKTSTQTSTDNKPSEANFPILSSFPPTSNANKCAPSFLSKSTPSSTSSQPSGLMFLSPPFPVSSSKSKSTSPGDNRDHVV